MQPDGQTHALLNMRNVHITKQQLHSDGFGLTPIPLETLFWEKLLGIDVGGGFGL